MREHCSPALGRILDIVGLPSDEAVGSHLLGALVNEEFGRTAVLFERFGLTREATLEHLRDLERSRPLSLHRLLANARALAREHEREEEITSDFFVLALLRHDVELLNALISLGLNHAALEREVLGETAPVPLTESIRLSDGPNQSAAGRILDVNANRARESLRILDDYARFSLNDPFLTGEIKNIRHHLAAGIDGLSPNLFLASRDTLQDVGTSVGTASEMDRSSVREVARINFKRLQESLRSLEEYGKTIDISFAERIEQIRYRSYTLEKALLLGDDARQRLADARLYVLLTGSQCTAALDWTIAEAVAGGASIFQLREKDLDDRQLLERARDVRRWTRKAGALFIMNDRPDIARLAEADGVHLGQDDMTIAEARRIVGPEALIGVSTHNLEQVRHAILDGAGYIGIGPTFPSTTKSFETLSGLDFIKAAIAETSLPAFAIGGINLHTIDAVVVAGASRVAVSAVIANADDPRQIASILCEALKKRSL